MHNSHQSFAARQRLLNYDGDASNQVIWFTATRARGAGCPLRPDAAGAPRARPLAGEHRRPSGAGRGREQAGRRSRLLLQHRRVAARTRPGRLGRDPRRRSEGRVRDGLPDRSRPRGSWPAARSRAGSSSARRNPSPARSSEASTGLASDRGRAGPAGADLPDGRLRLLGSRTRACRPSSGTPTSRRGSGRPRQAAARVPPVDNVARSLSA